MACGMLLLDWEGEAVPVVEFPSFPPLFPLAFSGSGSLSGEVVSVWSVMPLGGSAFVDPTWSFVPPDVFIWAELAVEFTGVFSSFGGEENDGGAWGFATRIPVAVTLLALDGVDTAAMSL
jgi:hypothetical protein